MTSITPGDCVALSRALKHIGQALPTLPAGLVGTALMGAPRDMVWVYFDSDRLFMVPKAALLVVSPFFSWDECPEDGTLITLDDYEVLPGVFSAHQGRTKYAAEVAHG